jgi:hypothetical protein
MYTIRTSNTAWLEEICMAPTLTPEEQLQLNDKEDIEMTKPTKKSTAKVHLVPKGTMKRKGFAKLTPLEKAAAKAIDDADRAKRIEQLVGDPSQAQHDDVDAIKPKLSLLTFYNGLDTVAAIACTKGVAGLALSRIRSAQLWEARLKRIDERKAPDNDEIRAQIDQSMFQRTAPLGLTPRPDNREQFRVASKLYGWAREENRIVANLDDAMNQSAKWDAVQAPADYYLFKLDQAKPIKVTEQHYETLAEYIEAQRTFNESIAEYKLVQSMTVDGLNELANELRGQDQNENEAFFESLAGVDAYNYALSMLSGIGNKITMAANAAAKSYGDRKDDRLGELAVCEIAFKQCRDFIARLEDAYADELAAVPYDLRTPKQVIAQLAARTHVSPRYFEFEAQAA